MEKGGNTDIAERGMGANNENAHVIEVSDINMYVTQAITDSSQFNYVSLDFGVTDQEYVIDQSSELVGEEEENGSQEATIQTVENFCEMFSTIEIADECQCTDSDRKADLDTSASHEDLFAIADIKEDPIKDTKVNKDTTQTNEAIKLCNEQAALNDGKDISKIDKSFSNDDQATFSDHGKETSLNDGKEIYLNGIKDISIDIRAISGEMQSTPNETQSISEDGKIFPDDEQSNSDGQTISNTVISDVSQSLSDDRQAILGDAQAVSDNVKKISDDGQEISDENKDLSDTPSNMHTIKSNKDAAMKNIKNKKKFWFSCPISNKFLKKEDCDDWRETSLDCPQIRTYCKDRRGNLVKSPRSEFDDQNDTIVNHKLYRRFERPSRRSHFCDYCCQGFTRNDVLFQHLLTQHINEDCGSLKS